MARDRKLSPEEREALLFAPVVERTPLVETFLTSDGYRLILVNGRWTDGDLTFDSGPDGLPVTADGEKIEGKQL